jgi:hypothetical protein
MKYTMGTVALVAATAFLGIIFVSGVRERVVNIPKWFENPPASFELIRQQASGAQKFWIPIQVLFLVALITALVSNWRNPTIRTYLLLTISCYVLGAGVTGAYFVKEVMAFIKIPVDAPKTPEILARTATWEKWTTSRNVLQLLTLGFIVRACMALKAA